MPTSTRRQAASRSQRYSEVSAGALSEALAAEDDIPTQYEQGDDGELEEEFEANGTLQALAASAYFTHSPPIRRVPDMLPQMNL